MPRSLSSVSADASILFDWPKRPWHQFLVYASVLLVDVEINKLVQHLFDFRLVRHREVDAAHDAALNGRINHLAVSVAAPPVGLFRRRT